MRISHARPHLPRLTALCGPFLRHYDDGPCVRTDALCIPAIAHHWWMSIVVNAAHLWTCMQSAVDVVDVYFASRARHDVENANLQCEPINNSITYNSIAQHCAITLRKRTLLTASCAICKTPQSAISHALVTQSRRAVSSHAEDTSAEASVMQR